MAVESRGLYSPLVRHGQMQAGEAVNKSVCFQDAPPLQGSCCDRHNRRAEAQLAADPNVG